VGCKVLFEQTHTIRAVRIHLVFVSSKTLIEFRKLSGELGAFTLECCALYIELGRNKKLIAV